MTARNPFSTCFTRPGALDYLAPAPRLRRWLAAIEGGGHWSLVGPHGTGKTTLLTTLRRHLAARGRATETLSLHDGGTRRERTRSEGVGPPVVFVDGYEQLSPLHRAWLRRHRTLLVTAHTPVLRVLHRTAVTPAVAVQIVEHLRRSGPATSVDPRAAAEALRACEGNMREALFRLYDAHEALRTGERSAAPATSAKLQGV